MTKMTKMELTNVVEVTYSTDADKNDIYGTLQIAMVHVPEESLPPLSEDDRRFGRPLNIYFKKAAEILLNEIGPINIHENRLMGDMTVVH